MPTTRPRSNRGPAAAAENRQALLVAARRVLSTHGYRAPLSAIAREAGVSQGVLYRHFDSRLSLAIAAFEAHFLELEALAACPGPATFERLWSRLVELTVAESAFVELVVEAHRDTAEHSDLDARVRHLVDSTLPLAQAGGRARPDLETFDVLLAIRMLFGVVVTAAGDGEVARGVARSQRLLGMPALGPSGDEGPGAGPV